MRDTRNLEQRSLTWHCVKEVPRPLRAAMGRKRLVRSLHTHDLRVAQARRYEVLAAFIRDIEAVRGATSGAGSMIDAAMAWRETLARIDAGDPASIAVHTTRRPEVTNHNATAADNARAEAEDDIDIHSETFFEEDRGTFRGIVYGHTTPLLHHLDAWLNEGGAKGAFRERTKTQHRTDVKRLAAWARSKGVPETVEAFTRKIAGRYVSEAIVSAGVHPVTGNRWLSAASAYWRWMMKRAGVEANPWSGQSLAKPAAHHEDDQRKRPFTDPELAALLAGDPGLELADLIRVAALSGMRLEEVYRLTVADCGGGWFNVRVSKTPAGRRRVPIHSDLESIVARRVTGKAPVAFLFHEAAAAGGDRGRSAAASKRFGHYRQARGVHERAEGVRHSAVDFHSLRRWFITAALQGHARGMVASVVGHKAGNITEDVYSSGPSDALRRSMVEAVKLPVASAPTSAEPAMEAAN